MGRDWFPFKTAPEFLSNSRLMETHRLNAKSSFINIRRKINNFIVKYCCSCLQLECSFSVPVAGFSIIGGGFFVLAGGFSVLVGGFSVLVMHVSFLNWGEILLQ